MRVQILLYVIFFILSNFFTSQDKNWTRTPGSGTRTPDGGTGPPVCAQTPKGSRSGRPEGPPSGQVLNQT